MLCVIDTQSSIVNKIFMLYIINTACRTGDLRLEGSSVQGSGRVEVCINNEWGTICNNSWSSNEARVVCKQLGFSIIGIKLHKILYALNND